MRKWTFDRFHIIYPVLLVIVIAVGVVDYAKHKKTLISELCK